LQDEEMLFLHTSDWHLGKFLFEKSLLDDQKFFLDNLLQHMKMQAAAGEPYDALIVAGDIYDKSVPSPEAVGIFSRFLFDAKSYFPEMHFFFISGNHDGATRLSFAAELLAFQNIHIATSAEKCSEPVLLEKGGEKVAVYQIPFLLPGGISCGEKILRHQNELLHEVCARIKKNHAENFSGIPSVAMAHVFASAAEFSGSETNFVGTAEQVDSSLFADFDYAALGHIHKKQIFGGGKIAYSGSPVPYNFGESNEKFLLKVSVQKGKTSVQEIPVKLLHKISRKENTFAYFLNEEFPEQNDYLEIVCNDNLEHENPMEILRKKFPNLLSFRAKRAGGAAENETIENRRKSIEEISSGDFGAVFEKFAAELYGEKSSELQSEIFVREKKLFEKLSAESEADENETA
jgi:exonuclease SbcD